MKTKNMTLQEAINQANDDDYISNHMWRKGFIKAKLRSITFDGNDVISTSWYIEPAKKSAFQEWFNGPKNITTRKIIDSVSAKEGWNAAVEKIQGLDAYMPEFFNELEKLKEP